MPLDEGTLKYLADVKKGKERKFAMLCKGVSIVGLMVYKKGNEERFKKELKKNGSGKFFAGVITGKGEKIVFNLSRESCDKPPTKPIALKEFLVEQSNLKFKPTYEIVSPSDIDNQGKGNKEEPTAVNV